MKTYQDFSCGGVDVDDFSAEIYFYDDEENSLELEVIFSTQFVSIDELPNIKITGAFLPKTSHNIINFIDGRLLEQMNECLFRFIEKSWQIQDWLRHKQRISFDKNYDYDYQDRE